MNKIAQEIKSIADTIIAQELQEIANEYEDITISQQIEEIANQLDDIEQGSYQDFVKAIQKPTRQNVMKYEKSITPKKSPKK